METAKNTEEVLHAREARCRDEDRRFRGPEALPDAVDGGPGGACEEQGKGESGG